MGQIFFSLVLPIIPLLHYSNTPRVFLLDRPEFTRLDTGSATNALLHIDGGGCLFLPGDRVHRTGLLAEATHLTLFRINPKFNETRTDQGRAFFLLNVGHIFISKIADRGEHGIRGCFSQTAV